MRALVLLAVFVLLFLALVWAFQRKLIYLPMDHDVPPASAVLSSAEEVMLHTEDGLALGAWLVLPHEPARGRDKPAPPPSPTIASAWGAVLVFNGNAGHRGYRAKLAEALERTGLAVLLFDYRGYGGNPGAPSEIALRLDADAASSFLVARGFPPERVIYFGESLGAAVAVDLATRRPPAALVLRSPFSSLADVARIHYPILPVRLLLRDRFASIERIRDVGAPLLVVAGERDGIVPVRSSRALFDAAAEPKRWVEIPGADHNDPELLAGRRMIAEIVAFARLALLAESSATD